MVLGRCTLEAEDAGRRQHRERGLHMFYIIVIVVLLSSFRSTKGVSGDVTHFFRRHQEHQQRA